MEFSTAAKVAMAVAVVIVIVAIIVIIYRVHRYTNRTEPILIQDPALMNEVPRINGEEAPISVNGRESTYNFWINVRDWSTGLGKAKCVLYRSSAAPDAVAPTAGAGIANPSVWLYPNENKMMIRVSTTKPDQQYDKNVYPTYNLGRSSTNVPMTQVSPATNGGVNAANASEWLGTNFSCDIDNIPLQRWVMVTITMWNRTLDVYINGKLVRSCILPGVPVNNKKDLQWIYVGSQTSRYPTFNGYMSRLKYFNRAITAKNVMSLYEKGPLPVNWWWSNLKNRLKVTLDINT